MAQLNIKWTRQALDDLESAREFIVTEYPQSLKSTIENIQLSIDQIKIFPEIGKIGRVKGTRELIFSQMPFILAYRQKKSSIEIISILHQSRKWHNGIIT